MTLELSSSNSSPVPSKHKTSVLPCFLIGRFVFGCVGFCDFVVLANCTSVEYIRARPKAIDTVFDFNF